MPDTVYIEKIVTVANPVVRTEQIVDTVYIERTVLIEKEQPQELLSAFNNADPAETFSQMTTDNVESQIFIRNNNTVKQEKERKLQIKFGGNKNPSNEGTLALITKLQ